MKPLQPPPKQTQTQVPSSVLCPPTSVFRRLPRRRLGSRLLTPVSELRTPNYELFCPQTSVCTFLCNFFKLLAAPCTAFCNFLESFADFAPFRNFSKNDPHFYPKKRRSTPRRRRTSTSVMLIWQI